MSKVTNKMSKQELLRWLYQEAEESTPVQFPDASEVPLTRKFVNQVDSYLSTGKETCDKVKVKFGLKYFTGHWVKAPISGRKNLNLVVFSDGDLHVYETVELDGCAANSNKRKTQHLKTKVAEQTQTEIAEQAQTEVAEQPQIRQKAMRLDKVESGKFDSDYQVSALC
ncbi:hypothetical protein CYMTET_2603 [Cymbomonas tetramitiformis]|uniref:Uncharacterized protein n=1 Tax=Cymbomonas tetramitiformis TaxID=36881 RepID=A0AAE0LM79_9CHLO|nr:hypothetical protein CYMTET_2603 [Cymbomonas tetramitiformis]